MRILHVGYGFQPFRYGGLIVYAEDLMEAQAARGHDVGYFFCGRRLPVGRRDRLRRWRRGAVKMREIVNSTIVFGGETGTLTPEDDLNHPPSERHFESVLDELRPDVVHVQELIGLPSSLLEIARERGIPTVMTLHDYYTLCPILKLFDVDEQICLRREPAEQCARCCAGAPATSAQMSDEYSKTVRTEVNRTLPAPRARGVLRGIGLTGEALRGMRREGDAVPPPAARAAPPPRYQRRRDVNVERLSGLDAAIAQSRRVAEIYEQLGVDPARLRVIHSTVRHLEGLRPKSIDAPPEPVRLVTLNGCASVPKGRDLLIGALEQLGELGGRYTMTVYGYVTDETRERLERLPNVEWAGYYDPADLQMVLEPFHVGVIPSVWEEVYGYVGLELLAAGLPVIGNARGGIVDYVRDGETGWVNRDVSPGGLAETIGGVVDDPNQIVELNASIRARHAELVKPFEAHVDEVLDVYAEVTARAGSAR